MNSHWLVGVGRARLGYTLSTVFGAGDTVNHTWCCAAQGGVDGVALPSVVAGVAVVVDRVSAHDTVRSFATFLENHVDLSSDSAGTLCRNLGPHNDVSQRGSSAVAHSWRPGHVGFSIGVPVHQTFPPMQQDGGNVGQPLVKRYDQSNPIISRPDHLLQCTHSI